MNQTKRRKLLIGMFILIVTNVIINKSTFFMSTDFYHSHYSLIMELKSLLVCFYIFFVAIILKCCIITKSLIFCSVMLDLMTVAYCFINNLIVKINSLLYVEFSKFIVELEIILIIIATIINLKRWYRHPK